MGTERGGGDLRGAMVWGTVTRMGDLVARTQRKEKPDPQLFPQWPVELSTLNAAELVTVSSHLLPMTEKSKSIGRWTRS